MKPPAKVALSKQELQLAALDKDIGLRGTLAEFIEMAWPIVEPGQPYCYNWHIDCYSEHCMAAMRGEIRVLIVNVPPGFSKSLVFSVLFPAWAWIRNPELRLICASFRELNITRDASRTLNLIRSPWYQQRWGDVYKLGNVGSEGSNKNPQLHSILNNKGGKRMAATLGGNITGDHANFHIMDDPVNPQDMDKATQEAAIKAREQKFSSRWIAPGLNSEIVVMQRLHQGDLTGYLLEHIPDAVHINLPMHYDPDRKCQTRWFVDPRETPGELLDESRFDEARVAILARDLTLVHARAQLEQDPNPASGSVFLKEWFQYYKSVPKNLCDHMISVDASFKGDADSDFVVIQVWARDDVDFYLLDQVRGRFDFPETLRQLKMVMVKWPQAYNKLIEDRANGSAIVQVMSKETPGIVAITPEGGKVSRANAVCKFFEGGNVRFPESAEWLGDFESELLKFPRSKHDDQVDSMTQSLTWLGEHLTRYAMAMANVSEGGGVLF